MILFLDVTIPVIVHVIYEDGEETIGTGYNIFHSRVEAAINSLNSDFQGTGIQFCLAKRYPDGTPLAEEGVVRVNASSVQGYNSHGITMTGDSDNEIKLSGPQFSSYDYLNIWTVKNINASLSGQVLGYASFPLQTAKHMDGITMDTDHFGISNWRVLTHEVGHYFRLYHTFNGDDPDYDGANFVCPQGQGDMVDDTDPHIRSASFTCPTGDNLCSISDSSDPNNIIYNQLEDIVNNHMDYSDESCRTNFTNDQVIRMQACILAFRYGLLDPLGCEPGCDPLFSAEFTSFPEQPQAPDDTGNNAEEGVFTAVNQSLTTYEWSINGVSVTDMDGIGHILNYEFQSAGLFQVCLRGTINGCSIDFCEEVTVLDAGLCKLPIIDPCELVRNGDFFESYPDELTINYPNYSRTSLIFNSAGNLTTSDYICNWKNSLGFMKICKWNDAEDYFYSIDDESSKSGGLQSSFEIDFQDGVTYEVSIDVAVMNDGTSENGEVYVALINDGSFENSWPSTFVHSQLANNKIHSFYFDQIVTTSQSLQSLDRSDFNTYSFSFTYVSGMPKYLFISEHGENFSQSSEDVYIDNISIKQCDFCTAQPQISYNAECSAFQFMGQNINPNSGGIPSWSVNGYTIPQSVGNYDFDFSFPWFGEYEVCLDITCGNGNTNSSCVTVTTESLSDVIIITNDDGTEDYTGIACEVCHGPTVFNVDAQRCGDDSKEFLVESFPIVVNKGYRPCLGDFGLTKAYNGSIRTNSYYVDESDPNQDVITVSFTFTAENLNQQMGALFAMCSPDGAKSECFRLQINNTRTCESCEGEENIIVSNMRVNCTDSNINDGVLEYAGDFLVSTDQGFSSCGNISSGSGLVINSVTSISGDNDLWSVDFELFTNQIGAFNTSVNLCFIDAAGKQVCYNIKITIDNPCIPDTDICEEEILPITLSCDRTDGDNAVYIFPSAVHLPNLINEGWVYCDADPVSGDLISDTKPIGWYGEPLLTTEGIGAYLFGVELTIPCENIRNDLMTTSIFLNLCNDGREMCVEIPLMLECSDCGSGKSEGRSGQINIEEYNIFPVPASESIIISVPLNSDEVKYSIFSPSGKIVNSGQLTDGENRINTRSLTNGLYYVTISDKNRKVTKKIIIID